MRFSTEELRIVKKWYDIVDVMDPEYLGQRDKRLADKILRIIRKHRRTCCDDDIETGKK